MAQWLRARCNVCEHAKLEKLFPAAAYLAIFSAHFASHFALRSATRTDTQAASRATPTDELPEGVQVRAKLLEKPAAVVALLRSHDACNYHLRWLVDGAVMELGAFSGE